MCFITPYTTTARRGAPRPVGLREGLSGIGAALTSWRRRVPAAARAQVLPCHVRLRRATIHLRRISRTSRLSTITERATDVS